MTKAKYISSNSEAVGSVSLNNPTSSFLRIITSAGLTRPLTAKVSNTLMKSPSI